MTKEDQTQEHQRTSSHSTKETIVRWRCLNCGQIHFTNPEETPPDICYYCRDMTTWKRLSTPPDSSSRPD